MKHLNTYINEFLVNSHTKKNNYDEGYVDLDLPSGTIWATCNLGAKSPAEFGDFFMFGATEPSKMCDWQHCPNNGNANDYDYKFFNTNKQKFLDDANNLRDKFDAAAYLLNDGSHIPTDDQCIELFKYTNHKYINADSDEYDGIDGWKIISKKNKENFIFIPLAGYDFEDQHEDTDRNFTIWSSTWDWTNGECAYAFSGNNKDITLLRTERYFGCSIRPVKDK